MSFSGNLWPSGLCVFESMAAPQNPSNGRTVRSAQQAVQSANGVEITRTPRAEITRATTERVNANSLGDTHLASHWLRVSQMPPEAARDILAPPTYHRFTDIRGRYPFFRIKPDVVPIRQYRPQLNSTQRQAAALASSVVVEAYVDLISRLDLGVEYFVMLDSFNVLTLSAFDESFTMFPPDPERIVYEMDNAAMSMGLKMTYKHSSSSSVSFWGLNGSNGEATNTDDMPRKGKRKGNLAKLITNIQAVTKTRGARRALKGPRMALSVATGGASSVLESGLNSIANVVTGRSRIPRGITLTAMSRNSLNLLLTMCGNADLAESLPYIGCGDATSSYRVRTVKRGTVWTGSTSFGFLALSPSVASDAPSGYYSNNSYAASTVNPVINTAVYTLAAGVNAMFDSLPYVQTQIYSNTADQQYSQNKVVGRTVGVRAVVTNTTNENFLSGIMAGWVPADKLNLYGVSMTDILSQNDVTATIGNRQSFELVIVPTGEAEVAFDLEEASANPYGSLATQYANTALLYPFSGGQIIAPSMTSQPYGSLVGVIALTSSSVNSSYFFEVTTVTEYVGVAASYGYSSKITDQDDYDACIWIIRRAQDIHQRDAKMCMADAAMVASAEFQKRSYKISAGSVANELRKLKMG